MINRYKQRIKRALRNKFNLIKNNTNKKHLLCVHISNDNIYAQIQKDRQIILSASTLTIKDTKCRKKTNKNFAEIIGKEIAKKALQEKITSVVLDRGSRVFNKNGKLGFLVKGAIDTGLSI